MKSRRKFSGAFKAKVALEAIKEQSSLRELSEKYQLEASQISKWKREFLAKSALVFEMETPEKQTEKEVDKLYEKIGRLEVQIDFLKKAVETYGVHHRRAMVERGHKKLSITEQCLLLNISHSGFYYVPNSVSERNLAIMNAIDRIHTEYPFSAFGGLELPCKNITFLLVRSW